MNILEKITPTCSNVYLIDENLCIGNSLGIINYTVNSLSSVNLYLENYQTQWQSLYSNFQTFSSKWLRAVTNVKAFSADWVSYANTVQTLSADWIKPVTLFYPSMFNYETWYSMTSIFITTIRSWLDINFPPNIYNTDQIINVFVYLYEDQVINFNFSRAYNETCTPNCAGFSLGCSQCPTLHSGCNHHGGLAGVKACDNLYDYCRAVSTFSKEQTVSCVGTGGKLLRITLVRPSQDTHVAETKNVIFKNINKQWVYQP